MKRRKDGGGGLNERGLVRRWSRRVKEERGGKVGKKERWGKRRRVCSYEIGGEEVVRGKAGASLIA